MSGTVERIGSRWIFGRTVETIPLGPEVAVTKGYWDTFFEIYVTSDRGVTVRVDPPSMRGRALIWGLAALVTIAVIAILAFASFG